MILIPSALIATIAAEAEAAYPAEGCGLLVGDGDAVVRVGRVVAADNLVRDRRHDRFELDPRVRFATERAVRGGPERVVGHWHSHPDGAAVPSATDIAQAHEPDLIWLIVAVVGTPTVRTVAIRAYRLDEAGGAAAVRPLALRAIA